jgi:hypothetical protein
MLHSKLNPSVEEPPLQSLKEAIDSTIKGVFRMVVLIAPPGKDTVGSAEASVTA